ncbi:hypothetical protein OPT61_g2627 [Boeremia exigua]|uniref:Uncharacterized protein n=1 Tax=Boeremia exigua TaxID=749465 RepID=A0ACC2IKU7_9PLEO|nr:hypothetical protein OPT61_g2627 [Boeremia exigua]
MAGVKVVYFLHNDVRADNVESLRRTLHVFPTDSLKLSQICAEYEKRRSKWSSTIISFIECVVGNAITQWAEGHTESNFFELSASERQTVWKDYYARDQAGMATTMWQPLGGIIDWPQIFSDRPFMRTDADQQKIDAVRIMVEVKYTFACEQVFQYRFNGGTLPESPADVGEEGVSAKQELKNWRGFSLNPEFGEVIDSVPVSREKANGKSQTATASEIKLD